MTITLHMVKRHMIRSHGMRHVTNVKRLGIQKGVNGEGFGEQSIYHVNLFEKTFFDDDFLIFFIKW